MVSLSCPFPSCDEKVENQDKEIAIALFNAHVSTHTVSSPATPGSGGSSSRSEKLSRPKISQGMLEEAWNSFLILWKLYKNGAALTTKECGLQLIYCCEQELMEQVLRAEPELTTKTEIEQLSAIRKLAVVPVAMGVRRSELLNLSQDVGEPSRSFLSRIQGKAATCDFKIKCEESCCSGSDKLVDFTSVVVKYVLVNGLSDSDIRREVLGWKDLDSSTLVNTVAFVEQKEMARDAFKGEAAAVKSGYKKQCSEELKMQRKIKCGGCDVQINQFAKNRFGNLESENFALIAGNPGKKNLGKR